MSSGSLLVLLDHAPANAARTRCALRLAADLGWHVVGLAPTDLLDLPKVPPAANSLSASAARVWDALRDQAERATDAFRDACHAAGVASFEAVVDETDKLSSVRNHARCSDLVVLTQADPAARDFVVTRDLIEAVVLQSARPTLVLPHAGPIASIGRRILVAWNGTREAARAAADALPLLRRAQHVELVQWLEGAAPAAPDALAAPQAWLARHGIAAHVRVDRAGTSIAAAMQARAAATQADLIVMGAYGHARWAEIMLGGATRDLLARATVPLLLSH